MYNQLCYVMVSLNDLMSGNILSYAGHWVMALVVGPDMLQVEAHLGQPFNAPLDEFDGVPITEEYMFTHLKWVLDSLPVGYQFNELNVPWSSSVKFWKQPLDMTKHGGLLFEAGDISFHQMGSPRTHRKIKYVHELQNAYYWAKGKHIGGPL